MVKKQDTLLQGMIEIPVTKETELVQCGTYNTVYPPRKESLNDQEDQGRCWKFGVKFEPRKT